jgi:hypothetical protein
LGFEEAGELLDGEQLVAHPAAVRLDPGVLPVRARLDIAGTRACEAAPVPQLLLSGLFEVRQSV